MNMGIYTVLETVIGLTFLFLLFSLVASVIAEMIARLFSLRSKTLTEGIESLLNDPGGKGIAGLLLDHSLIKSLGHLQEALRTPTQLTASPASWPAGFTNLLRKRITGIEPAAPRHQGMPSYIPSERFAAALTQTMLERSEREPSAAGIRLNAMLQVRNPTVGKPARNPDSDSLEVQPGPASSGLNFRKELMTDAQQLVASLPDSELRTSLAALAGRAHGDLRAFETSVAVWFDESMDRVSGWYQRGLQRMLLILGFLLAVLFNLDALHVAKTLSQESTIREAWANAAAEFHKNAKSARTDVKSLRTEIDKLASVQTPIIGWANLEQRFGGWYSTVAAKWACKDGASPRRRIATNEIVCLNDLALNAGHSRSTAPVETELDTAARLSGTFELTAMVLGWLLSAIAIGQGAPFWFNALERLLKIRAAGLKPTKTPGKPKTGSAAPDTAS